MSHADRNAEPLQATNSGFQPTHWTLILKAGGPCSPEAKDALNQLCQTYWFPLYAFVRGKGFETHKAKDLTQGFFVHLLETNLIKKADRQQGRFRCLLLASLTNFLEDERRREKAQKRGGAFTIVSIDETEAEQKYGLLPAHEPDSAKVFDGVWAATVVEQANEKLSQAYAARGRREVYESLQSCLTGVLTPDSYSDVAAKLGMTRQTLEVNLTRFRVTFGECVRSVIAETIADPTEIDDEIRYLMTAWAGYLERKQDRTTSPA